MTNNLDIEMYDRQIRTFGINASQKINNSSVCIIGLNGGFGCEIAKNLALCGIQKLYLYDDRIIQTNDLVTGYYYSNNDIGKIYSDILSQKINELNPNVKTIAIKDKLNFVDFNVLVIINKDYETILKYNKLALTNNIKFICLSSHEFEGHIFVDAGIHTINEVSSENFESIQLLSIDNTGIVTTNGHDFQTGDTIEIYNIQGSNIEFLKKCWTIDIINKFKFKLNNFIDSISFTFLNGTAKYIFNPIIIKHNNLSTFENNIFKEFNYNFNENIVTVSIMGSIVASETIKLISNKYTPINQFLSWSEDGINGTYKDKINESSWAVIGSGAIGCELLKNLAYLNVKNIKITDPDTIEKSNLSRQFLFRNNDVGKLKSEIATAKIKSMKSIDLNIEFYSEKVGFDNKSFTDKLLKTNEITGVFNALDNINARKFMDDQCFNYNKPLFESGTLGTKGNTQPIIPFITETYSNSSDPVIEKSFPVCTIKNFPNEITHTIHWAMDQFEFFNRGVSNLKIWLENKDLTFPNTAEGLQMNQDIYQFTNKYKVIKWQDCIIWAIDMFNYNFNFTIEQLLTNFPKDSLTDGKLFWSGGKRCPSTILFDISNEIHIDYIESTVKLLCISLDIDETFTTNQLVEECNKYHEDKIILNQSHPNTQSQSEFYDLNRNYSANPNPQVFEKDNYYHMKWINASSNLRAFNYDINTVDFYITKGIAGKIIPAIATTTSVVAGLIVIEMLKYLESAPLEKYKSTFVNLADNLIISAEPIKAPTIKICNMEFNSWFKFNHEGDCLLCEFIKKYEDIFKSPITMIAYNSSLLYSNFTGDENLNNKISDILLDLDEDTNLNNQIELTLLCEDDTLEIPQIIIKL